MHGACFQSYTLHAPQWYSTFEQHNIHTYNEQADATMALLEACGHALRAYAQQNLGRRRADANSQEEVCDHVYGHVLVVVCCRRVSLS